MEFDLRSTLPDQRLEEYMRMQQSLIHLCPSRSSRDWLGVEEDILLYLGRFMHMG